MFKCAQCDKVYKTRTSLTRHTHNHATTAGQHACSTCGVIFARRDILNRHVANGHCSAPNSVRRRCHTACEGCRASRIKCNGQDPCQACATAGKPCRYPVKTGRISQAPRLPHHPSATTEDDDSGMDLEEPVTNPTVSAGVLTPTPSPGGTGPSSEAVASSVSQHMDVSGRLDSGESLPNVPWPWLHENLFMESTLQDDPRYRPSTTSQSNQSPQLESGFGTANFRSAAPRSMPNPHLLLSPLTTVVENLVAYAANTAFTPDENSTRRRYWQTASYQLADIFGEADNQPIDSPQETLHNLIRIYLAKFNPLWPLLNYEQQDADGLHPVLFLTVSSIGAMFGSSLQRQYGTLMHQRLRRLLSASLYDLEGPEDGLIWLAQARMLTQVASLYFGQRQSFSYAQHLAAILVAQLRRMDCFREHISHTDHRLDHPGTNHQVESELWYVAEIRRRLAFGIVRTDIYTSILLGTRPLLTYEEVNMTLPRSDAIWLNVENLDLEGRVAAQRIEDARMSQIPFSDLVRIFLDRNEPKPPLSPIGYELCLFGLQGAVWSFSQDPDLFSRITPDDPRADGDGIQNQATSTSNLPPYATAFRDLVGNRRMDDLRADHSRLMHALDAWFQDFNARRSLSQFSDRRDTLMSSLLLYQLSRLRLCAPLENLHHISYSAAEERLIDVKILANVKAWTKTTSAKVATYQAWDIKSLIESEFQRPPEERARFNFLAFCSLHHSLAVLWTVAASEEHGYSHGNLQSRHGPIAIEDVEAFMLGCAQLFHKISPLGGASFEAAAHRLWKHKFPWNLRSEG